MNSAVRSSVGVLGVASVAIAALLVLAPGTSASLLPVDALASSTALSAGDVRAMAFASVGLACLLWVAWTSGGAAAARAAVGADAASTAAGEDDSAPEAGEDGPDSAPDDDVDFPALDAQGRGGDPAAVPTAFDRRLARTLASAARGEGGDDVRADVRTLAIDVVTHVEGCTREEATELVDRGLWTEDTVAALYVADREASLPIREWVDGWFRPRATKERRVRRSIRAIRDRLEDRGTPPETSLLDDSGDDGSADADDADGDPVASRADAAGWGETA